MAAKVVFLRFGRGRAGERLRGAAASTVSRTDERRVQNYHRRVVVTAAEAEKKRRELRGAIQAGCHCDEMCKIL